MASKNGKALAPKAGNVVARRQGRRALPVEKKTVPGSVRLTPARWAKLRRLGSGWLARAIDRAREPGAR